MGDKDLQLLLLLATMAAMPGPNEVGKAHSMFRRQLRLNLNKIPDERLKPLILETNDAWNRVKERVDHEHYQVSLSQFMTLLWDLMENRPKWLNEKLFDKTVSGLAHGYTPSGNQEDDTSHLADVFREELGIEKPDAKLGFAAKIALMKKTAEFNKVLTEGK